MQKNSVELQKKHHVNAIEIEQGRFGIRSLLSLIPIMILFLAEQGFSRLKGSKPILVDLVVPYGIEISFCYASAFIISKYALVGRRWALKYAGISVMLLIVFLLVRIIVALKAGLFILDTDNLPVIAQYLGAYGIRGITILSFSSIYAFYHFGQHHADEAILTRIKSAEERAVNAELRNAVLQAQSMQHLFYNTLNFIYADIMVLSRKKIRETIALLCELMQNGVEELYSQRKVQLGDELEQIRKYIALNKIRFYNTLQIQLEIIVSESAKALSLPPRILITFIENMFKHGYLLNESSPAIITIRCHKNILYFSTKNLIAPQHTPSTGTGISGVRLRLEHEYKDRHRLKEDPRGDIYNLTLIMKL